MGTRPASCESTAKRARACAFTWMQYALGIFSPSMAMTARHFVNFAPSSLYSARRSRSPSRPSVTVSPSAPASGFAPLSTLIPGKDPGVLEQLRERDAVLRGLADRLVVEDHPRDVVAEARGRKEQLPVGPTFLFGGLDLDRLQALFDRARALVRREDAFPRRHERARDRFQRFLRHHQLLSDSLPRSIPSPSGRKRGSALLGAALRRSALAAKRRVARTKEPG